MPENERSLYRQGILEWWTYGSSIKDGMGDHYQLLKARQRVEHDIYPDNLVLRINRAAKSIIFSDELCLQLWPWRRGLLFYDNSIFNVLGVCVLREGLFFYASR